MAPGRRLSMRSVTQESTPVTQESTPIEELANDAPRRRGKAKGLAITKHKEKNNNHKPRVEFKRGLLKPIGPWAAEFTSEVARLVRMNAPLAARSWKKVDHAQKINLLELILESFDVDLHVPHVRRAVSRFMGQRLKDFRSKLYRHYKGIAQGLNKRAFPHEDVQQEDWISMCDWFETDEFQKISEKNTESRKKQKDNHCCGSKPFVRIREEMKDQETQEEPGRVSMYRHTRFSKKKDRWVSSVAEQNYNMMNAIQSAPTQPNSTPLTEDQVYEEVKGKRSGYVNGLGHGQDPLSASALNELDIMEEARIHAERRAEEAERRAQEAQRRLEESERRLEESERRTNERLQAMQEQMLSFMEQYQPPSVMDLLMGGIRGMGSTGSGTERIRDS